MTLALVSTPHLSSLISLGIVSSYPFPFPSFPILSHPFPSFPLKKNLFIICFNYFFVCDRNGRKQIIVASYHQYIEVLDGSDGHPLPGWPYTFTNKQFVASPFLVDMDLDGKQELAVATKSGEIFFFGDNGIPIRGKTFKLDKLKVRKDWFEGFDTHQSIGSFLKAEAEGIKTRKLQQHDDDNYDFRAADEDEGDENLYIPSDYDAYGEDYNRFLEQEKEGRDPESQKGKNHEADGEGEVSYVYVDPHILATPVVEDLDGDGYQEIIVPVSYFFDRLESSL
jgi:hypothetical protein